MAHPFRRLKVRFFASNATATAPLPPLALPIPQSSELLLATVAASPAPPPLSSSSSSPWSSLFKRKKSHRNRIQSEKLLETASHQRASKLSPFRYKDRATRQPTAANALRSTRPVMERKLRMDEDLVNGEEKKRVQLVSHEFHLQLAQLVLGCA